MSVYFDRIFPQSPLEAVSERTRARSSHKAKFAKVIKAIEMIKPFVEICARETSPAERRRLRNDDNFLRNLWGGCYCEGWPSEEALEGDGLEEWYGDDVPEYILVKEDWIKACPFKYHRDWQYDYYTVLRRLEDQ